MNLTITLEELNKLSAKDYQLIDIRSEVTYMNGHLEHAMNIPMNTIMEHLNEIDREKQVILYCQSGILSKNILEDLRMEGIKAIHLEGGYDKWLLEEYNNIERNAEIERSIQKKFHKSIFSKFAKAVKTYELVEPNDKIAVCISGGKDSMLMAKLFQELKRHRQCEFELVFLVMDPGYNELNRKIIEQNAKILNIPITIFESDIFDSVYEIEKSPCYLCARMRRGHLYAKAKELGCNKIALGHHFDDVVETTLMGMLYSGQMQGMLPKLKSTNFEGMELIRPLYLIEEDDIKKWRDYNNLYFIQCACKFTDTCTTCSNDRPVSKRMETKQIIETLKKTNPYIKNNIYKSMQNVSVDTLIEYKKDGERHNFLEKFHK